MEDKRGKQQGRLRGGIGGDNVSGHQEGGARLPRIVSQLSVILIARINVAVGSLFTVMLTLSPDQLGALHPALKDPRVATVWIIVNGFISEYARRRPGSRDPV